MEKDRNQFISHSDEKIASTKKGAYRQVLERRNVNEYARTYDASPQFPFNPGAISAAETTLWDIHRDNPDSEKYGVMTNLFVVNNSSVTILLYPNQAKDRALTVPSGVQIEFDYKSLGGGITSLGIYNTSATTGITDGQVRFNAYKEGITVDQTLKAAQRLLYKAIGAGMSR